MSSASTGFSSQIGQNQFLQLLVAQMKSQNPLEPTSNQEFLGQLAQFSTLSGIESLNSNFSDMLSLQEITQGSSLIGKKVAYTDADSKTQTGTVDSVVVKDGTAQLQINGSLVTLDKVMEVAA
ncbi:MAG: flagellar hook capping protein [Schlesneria sp.]|nr:flagellar hook capping protein [Schlesneria sp.]